MTHILPTLRRAGGWLLLACLPLGACADETPDADQAAEPEACANAISTVDINRCLHAQVQEAEAQLQEYLQAARDQHAEAEEAMASMNQAQESWERFRNAHCAAVYTLWQDGSIRGAMHNQCLLDETRRRTQQIWQVYLTSMDDSPPVLPEPSVVTEDPRSEP